MAALYSILHGILRKNSIVNGKDVINETGTLTVYRDMKDEILGVAPISNNYILQYFSGSDRKINGQYI